MIWLKKVKIENEIWISIDFIFWIDCSMCVLLLISQHFKTVRNQRKETLKKRDILMLKKGTQASSFFVYTQ